MSVLFGVENRCSLSIYECYLVGNQGFALGEGLPNIYLASGSIMIGNWDTFSDGSAFAVDAYNMSLVIDKSKFMNNRYVGDYHCKSRTAPSYLIYDSGMAKNQTCNILRSEFINNTAPCASAIAVFAGNYSLSITDSLFLDNTAEYCGAVGLHVEGAAIIRSIFSHNSAVTNGGSICTLPRAIARKLSISDSTFNDNYAGSDGGVLSTEHWFYYPYNIIYWDIYPEHITADISNSSFTNNHAGRNGGVMYVTKLPYVGNHVRVTGSTFGFNSAASKGGSIAVNGSELKITDATIFNNSADIGSFISACNSNVSINDLTELFQYKDPSFPECMFYSSTEPTTSLPPIDTTSSLPITSTRPPNSKGDLVVWTVAISVPVVCVAVLVLLTAFVLGYLCRGGTPKCHKKSPAEGDCHGANYVPLINSS